MPRYVEHLRYQHLAPKVSPIPQVGNVNECAIHTATSDNDVAHEGRWTDVWLFGSPRERGSPPGYHAISQRAPICLTN